jgi:hypothetical protein
MPRVLFPNEPSQLTAMEKRLQNADLSQVHQTVEELTDLSHKTGSIAQAAFSSGLFEAAMKRTEELSNQEIFLNREICHLREEINALMIEKSQLTHEQIAQALDGLQKKIFSCSSPSTHSLQQELRVLENQWNHLFFLYTFPAAEELNPDSFISNYFHRMSHQIEQMRATDPEQAARLQTMLKNHQRQCLAAEQLFCGKGDRCYRQLPQEIQIAVQQRIFAHKRDFSMKGDQSREILAGAIMADLSDRMVS